MYLVLAQECNLLIQNSRISCEIKFDKIYHLAWTQAGDFINTFR